ncbi:MAG: GreA/GreB family elongation factor [Candidatus Limnocylindria bacterium]
MSALQADAERLAADADRTGGYVTAHMTGEPDGPSLVPNIDGQRLIRRLKNVLGALAVAHVESDAGISVIGRRVTVDGADGSQATYALVIPGDGDPAGGWVSVDSPVGRAIYLRRVGDEVRVEAPGGMWTATVVSVE